MMPVCLMLLGCTEDKNTHTTYSVYCSNFKETPRPCTGDLHPIKTNYRVFPEKQVVVVKSALMHKYNDCAVYDAKNWTCDTRIHDSADYDKKMDNGVYYDLADDAPRLYRQISRHEYIIRKIINFVR